MGHNHRNLCSCFFLLLGVGGQLCTGCWLSCDRSVTSMSVNHFAASLPWAWGGWELPVAPCLSSLSVCIHSALCASHRQLQAVRFSSEHKCFSSVFDFKSLGTVCGLRGEPAAGERCGRQPASSSRAAHSGTPLQVHECFHAPRSLGNGEMSAACRHICQLLLRASRGSWL